MSSAAGDQAAIANQGATTDAGNASTAFGSAQGDLAGYMSNVNSALAKGNPFEAKDYLTQQNLQTSGSMNSQNDTAQQQEQATVARTGTNSAALPAEIAEQRRAGQRDLTDYTAGRDTANETTWLGQQDKLFNDQARGASEEAGLYGTALGGQDSKLSTAQTGMDAQEAADDGMIDAGIQAAGSVAGGFAGCPARGSIYQMANGTRQPVESLKIGDRIQGIDGKPQTIFLILTNTQPVMRVVTRDGFITRNSYSHAFASPVGGFVESCDSVGSTVISAIGPTEVISAELDGTDETFNVITNGNHTYQADGVWSVGATEAEMRGN